MDGKDIRGFSDEAIAREARRRFLVPIVWDRDLLGEYLRGFFGEVERDLRDAVFDRIADETADAPEGLHFVEREWIDFVGRVADETAEDFAPRGRMEFAVAGTRAFGPSAPRDAVGGYSVEIAWWEGDESGFFGFRTSDGGERIDTRSLVYGERTWAARERRIEAWLESFAAAFDEERGKGFWAAFGSAWDAVPHIVPPEGEDG